MKKTYKFEDFEDDSSQEDKVIYTQACRQFSATGSCKFGKRCKFSHEIQGGVPSADTSDVKACRQFSMNGTCKFGDKCKFKHDFQSQNQVSKQEFYGSFEKQVKAQENVEKAMSKLQLVDDEPKPIELLKDLELDVDVAITKLKSSRYRRNEREPETPIKPSLKVFRKEKTAETPRNKNIDDARKGTPNTPWRRKSGDNPLETPRRAGSRKLFESSSKKKSAIYQEHYEEDQVEKGLADGSLMEGVLRISKRNRNDGYVRFEGSDEDFFVPGMKNMNRALDGDIVVVRKLEGKELAKEVELEKARRTVKAQQNKARQETCNLVKRDEGDEESEIGKFV